MNSFVTAASLIADEAAKHEEAYAVPAWGFGVFAFVVLGALLWATMMINVDR